MPRRKLRLRRKTTRNSQKIAKDIKAKKFLHSKATKAAKIRNRNPLSVAFAALL
jgi:hypothetical protein